MNKKDEEIQKKLQDLETTVLKESHASQPPAVPHKEPQLITDTVLHTGTSSDDSLSIKNELQYFSGIGSIILGFVLMFNWVHVGTGFMAMLGMGGGGFGLFMIPLIVGFGWMIYDPKNKIAMLLTGGTCLLIVLAVLASLVMSFPQMSLIQLILMLAPFAIGGALLLKGIGGHKAIEAKLKNIKS
ncbi:MAG TPA: hypothetical protein V6C81_15135 [Planktothrix sp.]|jgi:hypothetical protein